MSVVLEDVTVSITETNNNESKNAGKHKPPFLGFGILCCIMSGVVFSFNNLLVKVIHSNTALQLSASRCYVQFLILLPYVAYNWKVKSFDILGPPGMFKFLILRGLFGSSAAICLYQAVQRISLGDAVTLSFSNVVFAGILGYLLLKESFTALDGIMSVFAMAGIILIAQPSFIFGGLGNGHDDVIGVVFGLGAGVFAGMTFILIRKLGKATHASLNVLYYSMMGSITTTIMIIATNSFSFPCWHELPYVFLLGITGVFSQILMTLSLHYERASTVAVLRSFQIVIVFILQVLILNDAPSVLSLGGSGLIFFSIFALAVRKVYNSSTDCCNIKKQ